MPHMWNLIYHIMSFSHLAMAFVVFILEMVDRYPLLVFNEITSKKKKQSKFMYYLNHVLMFVEDEETMF